MFYACLPVLAIGDEKANGVLLGDQMKLVSTDALVKFL
jgi:hypothetical protein